MTAVRTKYNRWWWLWPSIGNGSALVFAVAAGQFLPQISPWEIAPFILWSAWCWYKIASFRCPSCGNRLSRRPQTRSVMCQNTSSGLLVSRDCEWCGYDLTTDEKFTKRRRPSTALE